MSEYWMIRNGCLYLTRQYSWAPRKFAQHYFSAEEARADAKRLTVIGKVVHVRVTMITPEMRAARIRAAQAHTVMVSIVAAAVNWTFCRPTQRQAFHNSLENAVFEADPALLPNKDKQ